MEDYKEVDFSQKTDNNNKGRIRIKNKKSTKDLTTHALKYGIAALSLVSFFTTSKGLEKVMSDENELTSYLISFGIQVIVLIVGSGLFNIINKIRNFNISKMLQILTIICLIIPYISSVSFSSFFSYVFLANNAYENVKETDYNIQIDNFFNEEIANIENLNETAGKVILAEIQNSVPGFKTTLEQFQANASSEINNIMSGANLSLYTKSEIDDSSLFKAETVINAYPQEMTEERINRLQSEENSIRSIADSYKQYYNTYKNLFSSVSTTTDQTYLSNFSSELHSLQNNIKNTISNLNSIVEPNSKYNQSLQSAISAIKIDFLSLDTSVQSLISVCDKINSSTTISSGNVDLNKIYNTIYSTINVSDNEIEEAINDLKNIITAYLNTVDTTDFDDTMLQNLSSCITYLGEFQKYKDLSSKIEAFEKNILNQVYVIEYNSIIDTSNEESNDTVFESTSETSTQSTINITKLDTESWNSKRREELSQFINIIKSLPDFNTIISSSKNTSTSSKQYINILEDNIDYKTEMLKKSYNINRDSLENISDIERAWNFISSDYNYMALYCLFVALFLDLTPFFVGIYTYFIENKNKKT